MERRHWTRTYPQSTTQFLLLCVCSVLASCAKIDSTFDLARSGDTDQREEALEDLDGWVRELRESPEDPDYPRLDAFLDERFVNEPNSRLRSQILSLAVQGEFPIAEKLIKNGITDQGGRIVQVIALQNARNYPLEPVRDRIRVILERSPDPMVRIEAIRTLASEIPATKSEQRRWALPLVDIFLDPTEKATLRERAYDGAVRLTGLDLGRREYERWARWRLGGVGPGRNGSP